MVGKIYFIAVEEYAAQNLVSYDELDGPAHKKFLINDSCQRFASHLPKNKINGKNYYCVDGCFCGIYRKQIKKYAVNKNLKKSLRLFNAGFERMKRNIKDEGLFSWIRNSLGMY